MDWSNVDFCDGDERVCPSDIVDLLVGDGKVFPESLRDTFEKRYAKMQNNFQIKMLRGCGNRVTIIPGRESLWDQGDFKIVAPIVEEGVIKRKAVYKDALLAIPQEKLKSEGGDGEADFWIGNDGILNYPCVGHDLPTWMKRKNGGNGKRIMIVSQDPLRTRHGNGKLLISSPFGFHGADYRNERLIMKLVNNLVLDKDAVVYLTDFMKIFNRDLSDKGSATACGRQKKNAMFQVGDCKYARAEGCCGHSWDELREKKEHVQGDFLDLYKKTLDAEIEKFSPDIIVVLGKDAANSLFPESKQWKTFDSQLLPHPKRAGIYAICLHPSHLGQYNEERDKQGLKEKYERLKEEYGRDWKMKYYLEALT